VSKSWETHWTEANFDADDALIPERTPLEADEAALAARLWHQFRYLSMTRDPSDLNPRYTARMLEPTGDLGSDSYPEDTRPILHSHCTAGISIEMMGTYWQVSWGSNEASTNFKVIGRGRTLAEAIADAERRA